MDNKIKEASHGNGGTYASLRRSGCLADMKQKGTKWIFSYFPTSQRKKSSSL